MLDGYELEYKDCMVCDYTGGTGCSGKIVVFFTITATPPSPTSVLETFKALNAMRVYSHAYKLLIFVQLIAAECWRGRGGKLSRTFGKKTQYLTNTLYKETTIKDKKGPFYSCCYNHTKENELLIVVYLLTTRGFVNCKLLFHIAQTSIVEINKIVVMSRFSYTFLKTTFSDCIYNQQVHRTNSPCVFFFP